jgi:N-acetylmuramoyl-L-alanine amidase
MMQNTFLDKSLDFAGSVQHQLVDVLHMPNRGVKQAGFIVLYKTAMPGVLIETGFLSNAKEEKYLLSEKGQDQIAKAIYNALLDYKNQVEKKLPIRENVDTLVAGISETVNSQNTVTSKSGNETKKTDNPEVVSFRVQFALYSKAKPVDSKLFSGIDDVKMYFHAGSYKYTSGDFNTMEDALQRRKEMISKGYKDAFVVAFKGKERITNEEARRLTEKKY